jgi:hypothetical protein
MAIENVKLIESIVIDEDDPRFAALAQELNPDCDFVQDKHGHWYVRGTGEPVSFANAYEERRYKRSLRGEAVVR